MTKDEDLELSVALGLVTLFLYLFQGFVAGIPGVGDVLKGFVAIFTSLVFFWEILYAAGQIVGVEETIETVGSALGYTASIAGAVSGVALVAVMVIIGLVALTFLAFLAEWAWVPVALLAYAAANPSKVRKSLNRAVG